MVLSILCVMFGFVPCPDRYFAAFSLPVDIFGIMGGIILIVVSPRVLRLAPQKAAVMGG